MDMKEQDFAEQFTSNESKLWALVKELVAWFGSQVETVAPADDLLACAFILTDEQIAEGLTLYRGGEQWPAEVLNERQLNHRPALTVNRLPDIVATSLSRSRAPLTEEQVQRVTAYLAYVNGDAQRLYNYLLSTLVEKYPSMLRAELEVVQE